MDNSDKNKNTMAGIVSVIGALTGIIVAAKPAIDMATEIIKKRNENSDQTVTVPNWCDNKFPTNLERAIEESNDLGLKIDPIPLQIIEANVKYKDYFDSRIIRTKPKYKQNVKPGEHVKVVYITQEVIDESQRLFDELEEQKSERAAERKEKIKNGVDKLLPIHRKQHDDEN